MRKKNLAIVAIGVAVFLIVLAIIGFKINENKSASIPINNIANTSWKLQNAEEGDIIYPEEKLEQFILSFSENQYNATTDCNGSGGYYYLDGNSITFKPGASTQMYCEDSLESAYTNQLYRSNSYVVEGDTLTLYTFDGLGKLIYKTINNN